MVFLELAFSREASAKTKTTVRLLQAFPLCSPGMLTNTGGFKTCTSWMQHEPWDSWFVSNTNPSWLVETRGWIMFDGNHSGKVPRLWFRELVPLEIHDLNKSCCKKLGDFAPWFRAKKLGSISLWGFFQPPLLVQVPSFLIVSCSQMFRQEKCRNRTYQWCPARIVRSLPTISVVLANYGNTCDTYRWFMFVLWSYPGSPTTIFHGKRSHHFLNGGNNFQGYVSCPMVKVMSFAWVYLWCVCVCMIAISSRIPPWSIFGINHKSGINTYEKRDANQLQQLFLLLFSQQQSQAQFLFNVCWLPDRGLSIHMHRVIPQSIFSEIDRIEQRDWSGVSSTWRIIPVDVSA